MKTPKTKIGWFALIGAIFGALIGFSNHGIGGALVGMFVGACVAAMIAALISDLWEEGYFHFGAIVVVVGFVIYGIVILVSRTWDVGK